MKKLKAVITLIISVVVFVACVKEQEGFPKHEKDTFTTGFIFRNYTNLKIYDVSISPKVYYPFENETLTDNAQVYDEINAWDSVYFEFREPVYTDCKSNIDFTLTFLYSAADSLPNDTFTNSFTTDFQPISYSKRNYDFSWNDEIAKIR